ncbi:TetR/AcrR family transcriptional regulator [Sneathiella sp.]|uniref:TetR/AcrR family transcriptional regulator n=1 Tax=Sneathiella sp. TaxID=1964365 RepID=UPI00356230DC
MRWANAIPTPTEQLEIKRQAIIREAAQVFNRRGSHGTTLDEVAERLAVTKTALYRYVKNKNHLLYLCHKEAMDIAAQNMDIGEAEGQTGLEKIQIGMKGYLREMVGTMGVPVIILEEKALTGDEAKKIIAIRDTFETRMRKLVNEGVKDGSIVPINSKLAIFAMLGAVHWVTKWYSPSGVWTPEEVSDAMIELVTRGFAASPSKQLTADIHLAPMPQSTKHNN